jgi:predicted nuclease of predicted toxin-antitoxin system
LLLNCLGGRGVSYRFLLDENVPRTIFKLLRQKGFHAEYVPQGANDKTVIEIAREKNLILITRDSDFADELMYPPNSHPGIVVLRIHPSLPKVMAERLAFVLENVKELSRRITIVYNDRIEIIGQ